VDISSFVSIFKGTKVQFFLELQAVLGEVYILAIFVIYLLIMSSLIVNKRKKFIFVLYRKAV